MDHLDWNLVIVLNILLLGGCVARKIISLCSTCKPTSPVSGFKCWSTFQA
jgi:hypothetical protein